MMKTGERALFPLGAKIVISAGIISIVSMAVLLYINFTAFTQLREETHTLLELNSEMNANLRTGISNLQNKYLAIPKQLKVDPSQEIRDWINETFQIEGQTVIRGRDNYRGFFNRSQRRDLSKGNYVAQEKEGRIIISKGILNPDGEFSDSIEQVSIKNTQGGADIQSIRTHIEQTIQNASSPDAVSNKIITLSSQLADEALEAEKARNAILYKTEEIEKKRTDLFHHQQAKQRMIWIMAGVTICLTLVLIHLMALLIVEKPLKKLSRTVDSIAHGEEVLVPYQNRKDRIGVLARVIQDFQNTLDHIRGEDLRKKQEQKTIKSLIETMSNVIQSIRVNANDMMSSAAELNKVAGQTEDETLWATRSAAETVEQTQAVSEAAHDLESEAVQISSQIKEQDSLLNDIYAETRAARTDIEMLNEASDQINEITIMVKNLAKESNLLALNARIEATRAGEAGKGFAVIASEVGALSSQTESANRDIAERVESIRKASEIMIDHTRVIETRIQRLIEAGGQISKSTEQQNDATAGIVKRTDATGSQIKEVSDRIEKVRKAAHTTNAFAHDVRTYSEKIEQGLSRLLSDTQEKLSSIGFGKSHSKLAEYAQKQDEQTLDQTHMAHMALQLQSVEEQAISVIN